MGDTVILGAGIVGCATAFYLSELRGTSGQTIHLVDSSSELFHCASGFAGGFLAADWFASAVAPLGALSFKLHKQLAEQFNGREEWGYSRSTAISLSSGSQGAIRRGGEDWLRDGTSRADAVGERDSINSSGPAWLSRRVGSTIDTISADRSVAQVGVKLHQPAEAVSVSRDSMGGVASVRIVSGGEETEMPCTQIVISAGVWTPKIFSRLFPLARVEIPISPLAGHSLLIKSPRWSKEAEANGCHAVFATETLGFTPELFSRFGEEIFLGGLNSTNIPLPEVATGSKVDPEATDRLKSVAKQMLGLSGAEDDLEILRSSLCFRPVTPSGSPIISKISIAQLGGDISTRDAKKGSGVFVAAGHGAWGISQSLGTGMVLSEMLEGIPTSVNIEALELR